MAAFIMSKELKCTAGENIIATIKMRKYFWYHLKIVIFQVTVIFSLLPLRETTIAIVILSKEFKCTVGENIIATIKMRKYLWYHLKMVIFQVTIILLLPSKCENTYSTI